MYAMNDTNENDEPDEDDTPAKQLVDAIERDNVALVQHLLQSNPGVALQELNDGWTPWEMTRGASTAVVDAFLSAGVEIDWRDGQWRTLAYLCAVDGFEDTLEHLASRGADLTLSDQDGKSPVEVAILEGQVGAVGFLLSKGCRWPAELVTELDRSNACLDLLRAQLAQQVAQDVVRDLNENAPSASRLQRAPL